MCACLLFKKNTATEKATACNYWCFQLPLCVCVSECVVFVPLGIGLCCVCVCVYVCVRVCVAGLPTAYQSNSSLQSIFYPAEEATEVLQKTQINKPFQHEEKWRGSLVCQLSWCLTWDCSV